MVGSKAHGTHDAHCACSANSTPQVAISLHPVLTKSGRHAISVSQDDYKRGPWDELNDSAFLFLCTEPRQLAMPMRCKGSHKFWPLDGALAAAARGNLLPDTAAHVQQTAAAVVSTSAEAREGIVTTTTTAVTKTPTSMPEPVSTKILDIGVGAVLGRPCATIQLRSVAGIRVLQPGLVLLRSALDVPAQQAL